MQYEENIYLSITLQINKTQLYKLRQKTKTTCVLKLNLGKFNFDLKKTSSSLFALQFLNQGLYDKAYKCKKEKKKKA